MVLYKYYENVIPLIASWIATRDEYNPSPSNLRYSDYPDELSVEYLGNPLVPRPEFFGFSLH